jgi:hypothetical protein
MKTKKIAFFNRVRICSFIGLIDNNGKRLNR